MRAKLSGAEIFFDIDGMGLSPTEEAMEERPVLFLLHGGPGGDHSGFKTQTSELKDTAQLVYIDHRGSGRSTCVDPATQTLDQNIDDVEALRQYLGLDSISILGSSYGGMVAQGYAIRYPQNLANLVLVATAPSHHFLDDAQQFINENGNPEQQRVCQWLWDASFESDDQIYEFYKAMGPMYATTFDAEKFEQGWGRGIRNYRQLNMGFSGFLKTFDFTPDLHRIQCPTLVLGGAHDWICAAKYSRQIAALIPRAHLKLFPNAGHSIAQDEAEKFLAAVRGFLTYPTPIGED